jgi:hypothetical protein
LAELLWYIITRILTKNDGGFTGVRRKWIFSSPFVHKEFSETTVKSVKKRLDSLKIDLYTIA